MNSLRRYFRHILLAVVLVAAASWPAISRAQTSETARAQQAFDKGMAYYAEKKYGEAINEFRKGYKLRPAGMFLYNISLSYLKLNNYPKALAYARRAQKKGGLPKKAAAKTDARANALIVRRHASAVAGSIAAADAAARAASVDDDPVPAQPASDGWSVLSYVGAGGALVGAGLIGGAVYMGSDVQSRSDALADVADRETYDRRRDGIESDRTVGQVLLYSGIGLAAAGTGVLVWQLVGDADTDEPSVSVESRIGGGGVGAQLHWVW